MKGSQADDILTESFRIIDAEIATHQFGPLEWPVVRRMIHASGDLGMAQLAHFSEGAAHAGVQAFQRHTPIIADVHMVATGIRAALREALDIEMRCFLDDPDVERLATRREMTRCASAMEHAVVRYPEAVYVVGNAPTALATLCAAVRRGEAHPRLIVAMPVGFVGVVQSKEEAIGLPVPVIAVRGRRGGSAVAAAAVNALLLLAGEGMPP